MYKKYTKVELSVGTFVFSKEHGRGIVTMMEGSMPTVHFEGAETDRFYSRDSLFAKGDPVITLARDRKTPYEDVCLFFEPLLHNPGCQKKYTIEYICGDSVGYVYDVIHAQEYFSEKNRTQIVALKRKAEKLQSEIDKIKIEIKNIQE